MGLIDDALFGDAEVGALFADEARIRAMLEVEGALALAQARLGIIDGAAGRAIAAAAAGLAADPAVLARGAAASGVATIALVEALKAALPADAAAFVHFGATSQDIIDSALMLGAGRALAILDGRLARLADTLSRLAQGHRGTVMAARTRWQQAAPTTFGLKAAGWLAPLPRHRERLAQLRPRCLVVQLGGAAGTLAALEGRGLEVAAALAAELGLTDPGAPWATQRDRPIEIGLWAVLVTGSLGKIGLDVALLAQSEVAEVAEGSPGASSTMPQKANPVAADALVTIARQAAALAASLAGSALAEQERGASAWGLEWLSLPPLLVLAGAALGHAQALADGLVVDAARMVRTLEESRGLLLAEAAVFALAAHMPMADARAAVKAAVEDVRAGAPHLVDALAARVPAPVDWERLRDPARHIGESGRIIDRVLLPAGSIRSKPVIGG
jgi:3-carboxy-cis,cis-muconate cycloisomerase